MAKDGDKPLRNPLLDRVRKGGVKKTSEMSPEERAALKREKYKIQNAALRIGNQLLANTEGGGERYMPLGKGELLKLARKMAAEGLSLGGRVNYSIDESEVAGDPPKTHQEKELERRDVQRSNDGRDGIS